VKKRAVLVSPVIGVFWDGESRRDELREEPVWVLRIPRGSSEPRGGEELRSNSSNVVPGSGGSLSGSGWYVLPEIFPAVDFLKFFLKNSPGFTLPYFLRKKLTGNVRIV